MSAYDRVKRYLPHTGALGLALMLIANAEGLEHHAFQHPGDVPTICLGRTKGVTMDMVADDATCAKMLVEDGSWAAAAVDKHVKVEIPDTMRAALIDFIYNKGETAFARSTMLKKINAGDLKGACEEFDNWVCGPVTAGKGVRDPKEKCYSPTFNKVVMKGLVSRMMRDKKVCLQNL